MKRLLLALPAIALAAACAANQRPYAPVDNVRYQAMGAEPFWLLVIGDDRIVLRSSDQGGEAVWPRTLPRAEGDRRVWQSGDGLGAITIEARPGPCQTEGEEVYADQVRVRLSGRELNGCGGRLIRRAPR
ncbi:MAG TPA: hypothetical protein VLK25_10805 [Allosphingosinicella sp.]|nr:hypothetical protein [Allosphingosinicella sp.]